jgi:hypothetical protein
MPPDTHLYQPDRRRPGGPQERVLAGPHPRPAPGAAVGAVGGGRILRRAGPHDQRAIQRAGAGPVDRAHGRAAEKPASGCPAEVWRVRGDAPAAGTPDELERLGYPATLRIGSELHDRQALLGGGEHESWPGIPYARRADTGGVRLDGPGGPGRVPRVRRAAVPGGGPGQGDAGEALPVRPATCGQTWRPMLVQESGRGQVIAGDGDGEALMQGQAAE